jgi:hypothetical protein
VNDDLARVRDAKTILLTTYKRDGTPAGQGLCPPGTFAYPR